MLFNLHKMAAADERWLFYRGVCVSSLDCNVDRYMHVLNCVDKNVLDSVRYENYIHVYYQNQHSLDLPVSSISDFSVRFDPQTYKNR